MQSSLYIQLISDCQYAILSHIIKRLKLSEPDLLVLASRKSSYRCPRSGLDASDRAPHRWPAAFATVSTPATEDRIFGQPPSQRSRRRRPRSAAASLAAVSTQAPEIRRGGQPPSPPSRRRQPRTASLASLPRHRLDAGGQDLSRPPSPRSRRRRPRSRMWPASLATVSTPAAEIRRGGPPPSPRSRRRRPRSAAVARLPRHGFDAGDRDTPRWPASLAAPAVSTPAAEIRRRTAALAACLFSLAKFLDQILSILR